MDSAMTCVCTHLQMGYKQREKAQTNSFLKQSIVGILVVDKRDLKAAAVTINTWVKLSVQ